MAQGSTRGIPIDTDNTLSANSNLLVSSQQAVKTYVDGKTIVDATPTDGSSNAVSSNGVFDALALRTKIIVKDAVTTSAVTGTTAETIISSYLIPANTFSANDIMNIVSNRYQKTGTNGTLRIRFYRNTSASLVGATLFSNYAPSGNTNTYYRYSSIFTLSGGNSFGLNVSIPGGNVAGTDFGPTGTAPSSTVFDTTIDNYIIVTVTLGSALDSVVQKDLYITN